MKIAYTIKYDFESATTLKIVCPMVVDKRFLLDVLTRERSTSDKIHLIDLQAVEDAHQSFDMSYVIFIRFQRNIARDLTNVKPNMLF